MKAWIKALNAFLITALLIFGCTSPQKTAAGQPDNTPKTPLNKITKQGFITEWLITGPFPNQEVTPPLPEPKYLGLKTDYLTTIGGETNAAIKPETTIPFLDENGKSQTAKTRFLKAGKKGIVNFEDLWQNTDFKIAYAYCHIESNEDQTAYCFFGSDDGARIWINGKQVHHIAEARACVPRDDRFKAQLHKGINTVLIKVSDRLLAWKFVLEVYKKQDALEIERKAIRKEQLLEFQNCKLTPQSRYGFMFPVGEFPKIDWEKPAAIEKIFGKFPLNVRWFDSDLNEAATPENPGRYAAVVDATTPDGIHIRRALTFFCRPDNQDWQIWNPNAKLRDWDCWQANPKAYLDFPCRNDINKKAWDQRREQLASWAGKQFAAFLHNNPDGPILMSYLVEMHETDEANSFTDTPEIINNDFQLALKRKLLGIENKYPSLKLPHRNTKKQTNILHDGTLEEAGFKPQALQKIRTICNNWYEESKEPFALLIARHGVIIINEPFGQTPARPITLNDRMYMASFTKAITALMFAQFVDQGLINIDDPVGKFLPDFPTQGEKAITLRHCFTHTTNLYGHNRWGGMDNIWLDNNIYNGLEYLTPGKIFKYNGMGYDLAGKVMETVAGKSYFRLIHENFFGPLGLTNTETHDCADRTYSTTTDIAKIVQLLLNKGSYGNIEFFSEETFEKLLPQKLSKFYPDVETEWGIGLIYMPQKHSQTDKTILSPKLLGHGAASSSIMRADYDNDLIIVQTRNIDGKAYDKYKTQLFLAIEEGLN